MEELVEIEEESTLCQERQQNLEKLFPDKRFTLLSNQGSSGLIFTDDGGDLVYKIYRNNQNYGYDQDEAAKLVYLKQTGLTPNLHQFFEPPQELQVLNPTHTRKFAQYDSLVPAVQVDIPVGLIVMDKVEFEKNGTEGVSDDQLWNEYKRIRDIAKAYKIMLNDIEIVLNKKTNNFMIIDVGGLSLFTEEVVGYYRDIASPAFNAKTSDADIFDMEINQSLLSFLARGDGKYNIPEEEMLRAVQEKDEDFFKQRLLDRTIHSNQEKPPVLPLTHTPLALGLIRNWLHRLTGR